MPPAVTFVLVALPVLGLALRLAHRRLPLRRPAVLTPVELVLLALAVVGLVLHCTSMFFPDLLSWIPGSAVVTDPINALGVPSMIWYAVPAVLLLVVLRRVRPVALAVLALTLLAVGVTMYNGSPLPVHLTTILTAVSAIVVVVVTSVQPAREPQPA